MKWFLILAAALLCNSLTTANADESSALLPPCGLVGEIQSRIADCKHSVGIQGEFQLVTRTLRGEEVYQGRRTGVIWSADIDDRTKQFENDQVDSICDQPHSEFGGIQRNLKLPSIHRYIQGLR